MKKDPTEFRERFQRWKKGEKVYEAGLPVYDGGKESEEDPGSGPIYYPKYEYEFEVTPSIVSAQRHENILGEKAINDYVANKAAASVSNAMHQAAPIVGSLLSAPYDLATAPEAIMGLGSLAKGLWNVGKRQLKSVSKVLQKPIIDDYMKAVQKGDMKTVLTLRNKHFINNTPNLAFKKDNGNPITLFRGVGEHDSDIMIIPELAENTTLGSESLSNTGLEKLRVPFFTTSHEGASGYGDYVRPFYAYVENPKYIDFKGKGWGTSPEKPSTIFTKKYFAENNSPENLITVTTPRGYSYLTFPVKPTEYLTPELFALEITPELKNKPFGPYLLRWTNNLAPYELREILPYSNTSGLTASYKYKYDTNLSNIDGLIMLNVIDAGPRPTANEHLPIDDVVIFNPNRIKSADPITYFKANDPEVLSGLFKEGDVIPLSMRDNFSRNDIRFGLLPFIFSTLGTTAITKKK